MLSGKERPGFAPPREAGSRVIRLSSCAPSGIASDGDRHETRDGVARPRRLILPASFLSASGRFRHPGQGPKGRRGQTSSRQEQCRR
jgi:hypothetical protein